MASTLVLEGTFMWVVYWFKSSALTTGPYYSDMCFFFMFWPCCSTACLSIAKSFIVFTFTAMQRMVWFSCWQRTFGHVLVLCTSGTSWSQEWLSCLTTTQMSPRNVATGMMLRSRGSGRRAPSERSMLRLSLGKAIVAYKLELLCFVASVTTCHI